MTLDTRRYDDRDQNVFGFTRYVGDVKAYLPLGYRNRYLAFRARTSHALPDRGQRVPFYLMETVGRARTLRGYSEYRFRDTRNLLLSAEYRWEMNSSDGVRAAQTLKLSADYPTHFEGWRHFTQGAWYIERDFEKAGLAPSLHMLRPGQAENVAV